MNRDVVANALNMSMKGGGFAYLISSMEKYGFVRTGGGKLVISDLGKLALYGTDEEKKEMMYQAVIKVELFNELYSQYGKEATVDQIKAFLRQNGNVPVEKAQKLAEKVEKIYKNAAKHIIDADKLERPEDTPVQSAKNELEPPSPVGRRFDTQSEEKKDLIKVQIGSNYF
ncbi:MAG: hypothetical protein NWF00_01580 [Candidatus Bathyarchaeota archaeon]|nr:hypothetical protein [Candidatus Bathyarchaeota archaeon]